jgi:hypothetical protein
MWEFRTKEEKSKEKVLKDKDQVQVGLNNQ